jgi:hypothetical protein
MYLFILITDEIMSFGIMFNIISCFHIVNYLQSIKGKRYFILQSVWCKRCAFFVIAQNCNMFHLLGKD